MLMNLTKTSAGLAVLMATSLPSHAAVVFNLQEVGPVVVLSGSGTLNLAGLTYTGMVRAVPGLGTSDGFAGIGNPPLVSGDGYTGFSGPNAFGSGPIWRPSNQSGDYLAIRADTLEIHVPRGYTSGSLLSGSSTFANQTLASLGATIGTYTWTWGSGATADAITLNVGSPITPVPEPSAYALALAGLGVLGFWSRRQKASKRQAEAAAART